MTDLAILLAVQPIFAEMLLDGSKTVELRKRFPLLPRGRRIYIYASAPVKAVVGMVLVNVVEVCSVTAVWNHHLAATGASVHYLENYIGGRQEVALVHVSKPQVFEVPVGLHLLRDRVGVTAPQSYRYVDACAEAMIRHLATARPSDTQTV